MSFMTSYKRLDNLCKDLLGSDKGVTSYIEEMENRRYNRFKPASWGSDYGNLKHYRYIRNQIAHDNYAEEEDLCGNEDILWIEEFHKRILERKDPLAQYVAAEKYYRQRKSTSSRGVGAQKKVTRGNSEENKGSSIWPYIFISLTTVAVCICLWLIFAN